ncbi:hypothetical protein VB264_09080 [Arcicella aquatica]|uniref:Fibronectin type-III domain-containing protein n=1 Tax=Arcicella aquatica TaxID=217141 RepID=A0ABU5QLJ4_9BACT|nr:hypothetical protein [Arcicella aquatica]MEA5257938.1 hypothetical protein [Arcicella aquatica]
MKLRLFLSIIFLLSFYIIKAQRKDSIQITISAKTDRMLLRWQPNNEFVWEKGISLTDGGYYVERKTVERNGVSVSENFIRLNNGQPIKPILEADFKTWLEPTKYIVNDPTSRNFGKYTTDSVYHLIAAQAMYKTTRSTPLSSTLDVDTNRNEKRARYDFAMLGAAFSYSAAKMSGLGYVDTQVLPNEKYQYRIILVNSIPADNIQSEISKVVTTTNINQLPTIPKPRFKFTPNQAELDWRIDTLSLKDNYIGYHIERAVGIEPFKKINKQILVKAYRGTEDSVRISGVAEVLAYRDNPILNKKTYYYRIVGKTLFDELAYSAPISGVALPDYVPTVKFADMIDATNLRINWEFKAPIDSAQTTADTNDIVPIKKYIIERGSNDSTFVIVKDNISANDTTAIITFPNGGIINASDAHYLRVIAVPNLLGAKNFVSSAILVQPIDSIAPYPPKIIDAKSKILTNVSDGEITLTYQADARDNDVVGFHIFRSDKAGNETVQISNKLISTTTFKDTINTTLLNETILYRALAVDKRGNRSKLSDSIIVQRPDVIPPSPPIIKSASTIQSGVQLKWIRGKDRDSTLNHAVYKKQIPNDAEWIVVVENLTKKTDTVYTDKNVLAGKRYVYMVVATDRSGNKSVSIPRIVDVPNSLAYMTEITSIKALANRSKKAIDINWEVKGENVSQFQIYRSVYPNALTSWNILSGDELATIDRSVEKLTKYRYAIRGVLSDGSVTKWITTDVEYPDDCEKTFKIVRKLELTGNTLDEACEEIELKPGFDTKNTTSNQKNEYKTKLSGQN